MSPLRHSNFKPISRNFVEILIFARVVDRSAGQQNARSVAAIATKRSTSPPGLFCPRAPRAHVAAQRAQD
eukprot:2192030-Pleurochrysis_carterae.AAC.1